MLADYAYVLLRINSKGQTEYACPGYTTHAYAGWYSRIHEALLFKSPKDIAVPASKPNKFKYQIKKLRFTLEDVHE